MKVYDVRTMLKKYKFTKIYLYKRTFVVLDTNTHYYRRVKGNHTEKCPETPVVYDWAGNLFVGNFKSRQSAEVIAEQEREKGVNCVVGPVAPLVFKSEARVRFVQMDSLYPDGVGLYRQMVEPVKKDAQISQN